MGRTKDEVLTIRTTAKVKALLKLASERERRSSASMIGVLVLDCAASHGLVVPDPDDPGVKTIASNKSSGNSDREAGITDDRERPPGHRADRSYRRRFGA
ncbi:MAG: hypothetical protein CME43_00790 [Haliea sp.]|nr:hypothetical protein [Haliea sp.]